MNRLPVLGLLLAAGVAGIVFASRAGGAGSALLAAIALACAVALVVRIEPASRDALTLSWIFDGGLLLLPGVMVVYFAFNSGGYFPAAPALAALVLVVLLVLRVTLVERPFEGFSARLGVAAAALGALCVWILLSAIWSDAPGRSLVEFDRAFAYLLMLVLFGSIARTSTRLRWLAGSVALGALVVAVCALATRLMPDRFPIDVPSIGPQALTYPVSYANTLGMLCVVGAILALYFGSAARETRIVKALGCAALPILSVAVYLTLSRGPVAAAIVGIGAFALIGRPRGMVLALIAAVPTSAIAVASAYHHEALTARNPPLATATSEGHEVATVLLLCVIAAAVIRLLLTPLDERLAQISLPPRSRRPVLIGGWAAAVLVVVAIGIAAGAPDRISEQYHRFVDTAEAGPNDDIRASVFDPDNRGLIDNWSVGLEAFGDKPLSGKGAGTYEVFWNEKRPANQVSYNVVDGHSLYVEILGELGLVGFALMVILVGSILLAVLRIRRREHHTLYAALFATTLAWAVHAGVDWDWEMPALTAAVIAMGAAGLAAHRLSDAGEPWPSQGTRVTIGLLVLVTAVAPGLVLASQRQLDDARNAVDAGSCSRAVDRSAASIDTLDVRPEPYEILGFCQAKAGRVDLAIGAMEKAVRRDPDNWRYHYSLATYQGAAGRDPRPELETALRLNPHQPDVKALLASVPKGTATDWELVVIPPAGASAPQP